MEKNLFHNVWNIEVLDPKNDNCQEKTDVILDFQKLWERVVTEENSKCFEVIFNHYYNILCSFALRYVKYKEEARDNVSEVFYRMWKNRKKLEISTSIRAYLFIAVRNQCLNYISRSATRDLSLDKRDFLNPSPNPHELFALGELESDLNNAINSLSPQCKHVFLLSRSEGMKYNEISTKLNITEKAVEANMSRALKVLRVKLKRFIFSKE